MSKIIDNNVKKNFYWEQSLSFFKEIKKNTVLNKISMCLSDICNLKCPPCHTHNTNYKLLNRHGYTTYQMFEKFIKINPEIKNISTGNGGEIFLNPDIISIFDLCGEKNIDINIDTGTTLNTVNDQQLESLIRNKIKKITVSIDGTTQEVYEKYRVGGSLERVFKNINKINFLKKKFNSQYPELKWQFIPFSHNIHQLDDAKNMARSYNMQFYIRPNFFSNYDKGFNSDKLKEILGGSNLSDIRKNDVFEPLKCSSLWKSPYIFWDGGVFGCCSQKKVSFGNAFEIPLIEIINSGNYLNLKNFLLGEETFLTDKNCGCFSCSEFNNIVILNQ